MALASCIYRGEVRHRRRVPVEREFRYDLFLMYLDLAELPELFDRRLLWSARGPAPAWFRRADHIGDPTRPLDACVRDLVAERTGRRPAGPVRMLTHLRYWGYVFNPVTFYYCFDAAGDGVEAIVADVHNTPWGERHAYVLADPAPGSTEKLRRYRLEKTFHVSPFLGMDYEYDWRFTVPSSSLAVHMRNLKDGRAEFDATLSLRRREISTASLAATLAGHPFMTAKVVAAIYWQALKLWARRVPFRPHPDPAARIGG